MGIYIVIMALFGAFLCSLLAIAAILNVYLNQTDDQNYENANKFWQNQGFKGPKGIMRGDIYQSGAIVEHAKRELELGKVYGAHDGPRPVLVVADPNVMHQLCVKDFNAFPNRSDRKFVFSLESEFLHNMHHDQWRRVRPIWSSAFTCVKMRRMYRLIDSCTDDMLEALDKRARSNPIVDLNHLFNLYTMDSVVTCCYSLRLSQDREEAKISKLDEFVQLTLKMFELNFWQALLVVCWHRSVPELFNIGFLLKFASMVQQLIKRRRNSGKGFSDFLQTLIDAETGENSATKTEISMEGIDSDVRQKSATQNIKEKLLSESEILASATLLFRLGFETTSMLLTNCVYTLSFHQETQEKLHQIIRTMAKYDANNRITFDFNSLITCKYLDAVISETFRKHPPVLKTERCASEDYHLESHKLCIPKGTGVLFDLEAIMNDPDSWPKPEIFDPERFMPENQHKIKLYSYCPFGVGPRQCMAMRFSLTESKLALSKLLLEYRFEPAPGTEYPAECEPYLGSKKLKLPEVMAIKR